VEGFPTREGGAGSHCRQYIAVAVHSRFMHKMLLGRYLHAFKLFCWNFSPLDGSWRLF